MMDNLWLMKSNSIANLKDCILCRLEFEYDDMEVIDVDCFISIIKAGQGLVKVDFKKLYGLDCVGIQTEDMARDIIMELSKDELDEDDIERFYNKAWLMRNVTLTVVNKNKGLYRDPIYQELGDTDLVLAPSFMSNRLSTIGRYITRHYNITENELMRVARRNFLATVDDLEICLDGSLKVEDTAAFVVEYLDEMFGNKELYIAAYGMGNVKVYMDPGKIKRETLKLYRELSGQRELSDSIIIYKNGKFKKERL